MNFDEPDERRYQGQENGDDSGQSIRGPHVSPSLSMKEAQLRRAHFALEQTEAQRTSAALPGSSIPPFPPQANFHVGAPNPLRHPDGLGDPDGLGIDLSFMPPRLTCGEDKIGVPFDTKKPTCSINLLCRRDGTLQKYQVQVISKDRRLEPDQFESLVASNKGLIQTDVQFFTTIKKVYEKKMYGTWRMIFSLKTLREIRLISVSFALHCHRFYCTFLIMTDSSPHMIIVPCQLSFLNM